MQLSLGPIQFYWPREAVFEFYRDMRGLPLDVIYLGETVCSKRRAIRAGEWIELAQELAGEGREVVLASLALLEAESELSTLKRLCSNGEFAVEANDIGAVQMLAEHAVPFVAGPAINIYNAQSLRCLHGLGLYRWVPPVELDGATLAAILRDARQFAPALETEVFSYGRLPLAWSARCFTARAHNLPKDDCRFTCLEYPDGLALDTQEGEAFLSLNGIQTQSAGVCDLLPEWQAMQAMGVSHMRISPRWQQTAGVVERYRAGLAGRVRADTEPLSANGYWHGLPGMDYRPAAEE